MTAMFKKKQGKLGGLSDRTSDIILIVFSLIILLIVAYPLYYVLVASFSDPYCLVSITLIVSRSRKWSL